MKDATDVVTQSAASFDNRSRRFSNGQRGQAVARTKEMRSLHDDVIAAAGFPAVRGESQALVVRMPRTLYRAVAIRCERTGQSIEGQVRVLLAMLASGRLKVMADHGGVHSLAGVRPESLESLASEVQERQAAENAQEGEWELVAMLAMPPAKMGEFLPCKKNAKKLVSRE